MTGYDPLAVERLAAMRRSYEGRGLDESDLAPTWLEQLRTWLSEAAGNDMVEPNAMVLATAGPDLAPAARTVLLKALDERGLVFHTNRRSRKGRQLAENPRAGVVFPWFALARQVHAEGRVEWLGDAESDAYWASRPRGSQIGSAASAQSEVIGGRGELEARAAALDRAHHDTPIPRPEHWGGVLLVPDRVEFWQGRTDRLHDRLRYRRAENDSWVVERLAP